MSSIKKLWNEWEIHCLVVLSFTLQFFLFFTGSLRRRSTNKLLNFIIWIAYLGADLVAVYAVGFLSRQTSAGSDTLRGAHQLAFFWAPFLLIHLGGQDTITAFAIEDNNLWLRHLLNLIVQVTLAIYVFWKSIDQYSYQLIASGIFVSVTGVIKYGERTMALMYGNLRNMDGALQKNKNMNGSIINEYDGSHITEDVEVDRRLEQAHDIGGYAGTLSFALQSADGVRELFAGHTLHQMEKYQRSVLTSRMHREAYMPRTLLEFELLESELGLMYDDLFTKAQVIRTKSGIVLRSLSQISMVVAFVFFIVSDHHRYSRADLAITYLLFSGAFFLEACAVFLLLMSPWTWSWLKDRRCFRFAHVCTTLHRLTKRRTLWSNSMGQYSFLSYVGCEKSRLSKLVKRAARITAFLVGANEGKKPMLWLSKLLDTEHVMVDERIMESIIRTVYQLHREGPNSLLDDQGRRWPNIGPLLKRLVPDFGASLGYGIVCFHIFTVVYLREYTSTLIDEANEYTNTYMRHMMVTACRNLSNYMLYLLVTRPEMLPVSGTTVPTINFFLDKIPGEDWHKLDIFTLLYRSEELLAMGLPLRPEEIPQSLSQTGVEEMMNVWTRLLVYSAGKSRAAVHAAGLSTGGELITFAWLLMAHNGLGDVGERNAFTIDGTSQAKAREIVLFPLPLQGHISPMLQLATLLHARGFAVTVLHTRFNAPDPKRYPAEFTFVPIDESFSDEVTSPSADIVTQLLVLNDACEAPFRKAILSLLERRDNKEFFACVVVDGQCYSALRAAHQLGVPALALRTDSAATLRCMLAYRQLRVAGWVPVEEERLDEVVPVLQPLRGRDLIRVDGIDTDALCSFIGRVADATRDWASGVVINTFEGIEESELAMIQSEMNRPAFAVGPLHLLFQEAPAEQSPHAPDRGCLAWLDARPPRSVLYVSLGSMACVERAVFEEMAWGLAASGVPFLWVLRPGLVSGTGAGEEEVPALPDGFSEVIRNRGKIVSWAPQGEVLAHAAIGAFWTHCGWNSVLESVCEGVPMLVQPCFADQMVNARYVTHEWRVGLEVGEEIERRKVAEAVARVMIGEDAAEMRERARRLQIQAPAATSLSIDNLVRYIWSL